jgi:hypothetical protein
MAQPSRLTPGPAWPATAWAAAEPPGAAPAVSFALVAGQPLLVLQQRGGAPAAAAAARRARGGGAPPPLLHAARRPPPFARILGGGGGGKEDERFLAWLEALAAEEVVRDGDGGDGGGGGGGGFAASGPRHDSTWYQERCVFCAECKAAVDAEVGRRGVRCAGCRRWFHARCCPALSGGRGGGAAAADGAFFHSPECEAGYRRLCREAAKGRRALAYQPQGLLHGLLGGLLGGARSGGGGAEAQRMTVRLIDFADAKRQVREAPRRVRGGAPPAAPPHRRRQRPLPPTARTPMCAWTLL